MKKHLLLPLAVASLSSVAGATYTSAQYGFSVAGPKGWKQISPPGVLVAFVAPTSTAQFATNTNVLVEKLPAGITMQRYADAGQATLKRVITDYRFLGIRDVTLSGKPGKEQMFSGKQGQFNLYFVQTFTLVDSKAYVLTGTTQLKDRASLSPAMAEFTNSFRFKR